MVRSPTPPTQSVPGNAALVQLHRHRHRRAEQRRHRQHQPDHRSPVVQAETFSTGYGKPLTLTPAQLLAGDSDPQGGTLTVTAVSGPGATLNSDGSVTYTAPTQSVPGNAASFSYTVTDTAGLSSTATANISLTTAPPGGAGRDLQHRLRQTADPHPGTAAGRRQRPAGRHADRHGRQRTRCDVEQRWFGHLHRADAIGPWQRRLVQLHRHRHRRAEQRRHRQHQPDHRSPRWCRPRPSAPATANR